MYVHAHASTHKHLLPLRAKLNAFSHRHRLAKSAEQPRDNPDYIPPGSTIPELRELVAADAADGLGCHVTLASGFFPTISASLLPAGGRHPMPYELMEKAGSGELEGEMGG
jgi:hypothetical protein